MISLFRLQKLPPVQAKRKTAKIFYEADLKFARNKYIENNETGYLTELLGYWIVNMPDIADTLESVRINLLNNNEIRRNLNTAYNIFLRESGKYPSEWDFDTRDTEGGLDPAKRKVFPGMEVYLEDIRSPFNVGSIFRTAESFGAEKIWLSKFCADPGHPRASRTAMGCIEILPWSQPDDEFLKGKPIFALETGGAAIEDFKFPQKGIMIVGSEELGVSPKTLEAADASLGRVSIPVYGAKGSLNVSAAFAIAVHAWAAYLNRLF